MTTTSHLGARSGRACCPRSARGTGGSSSATSWSTGAAGSSSSPACSSRSSTCSRSASASAGWSGTSRWPTGRTVGYVEFVAPAMLATSAMNGALFDATYNIFFKMKYAKLYDAMLATPLTPRDVARGEITWALLRGACYSAAFIVVMLAMGLVSSWWMLLALPATLLIGYAFAGAGMALTTWMRTLAGLRLRPARDHADVPLLRHVLPAVDLPGAGRGVVRCTPLYQGVSLLSGHGAGHHGLGVPDGRRLPRHDGFRRPVRRFPPGRLAAVDLTPTLVTRPWHTDRHGVGEAGGCRGGRHRRIRLLRVPRGGGDGRGVDAVRATVGQPGDRCGGRAARRVPAAARSQPRVPAAPGQLPGEPLGPARGGGPASPGAVCGGQPQRTTSARARSSYPTSSSTAPAAAPQTYMDSGAAHVAFADPYCPALRRSLVGRGQRRRRRRHDGRDRGPSVLHPRGVTVVRRPGLVAGQHDRPPRGRARARAGHVLRRDRPGHRP